MAKTYSASDIKILEGLDAVRTRPGMYIGTTSIRGLHHILWEIVDNAIDEAANGYANKIDVELHPDGSISVEDNGRGIPVDIHPETGLSGVEVVFTHLHAGGKFDNDNYQHSGGLHGVGASVTNALSEWLTVEVYKHKTTYRMEFESPEVDGKIKSGVPKYQLFDTGIGVNKKGTMVRFKPDPRVFETVKFRHDTILDRLKELAFLNKGTKITLTESRGTVAGQPSKSLEFFYEGGLTDYVKYLNEAKTTVFDEPIHIVAKKDNIQLDLAIQYTDAYTESLFSYVNNIPTSEGGMHVTGFKNALTKVMNDQARKNGMLKEKEANLLGDDYREGMTAVISIKMQNIQFEGQTKTKLGNPEAKAAVDAMTHEGLDAFFTNLDNKPVLDAILKKALLAAKVREAARKEKEIIRAQKSIENFNLVGKLSACTGKKPEQNELYIVEGDSAGGTAKQARNRSYQAILPLRGKPLNAEKKRIDQVLANEEIRTIISALGCGIQSDFNSDDLNYHKVIILSDADQDGAHIRAILLTFFFRYMRDLIANGHVYIGLPPLFKISKKDNIEYCYDAKALDEARSRFGSSAIIQRYKGLGEMSAEQLWSTTMNPEARTLVKVSIEDAARAEKLVSVLMGDAVDQRKTYIIDNADFNKEDSFKDIVK